MELKNEIMRKFTLEQYIKMSISFNKMNFTEKIKTIKENADILILASDHNWWGVKILDNDVREELEDQGIEFEIEREWDSSEINSLIYLLGLKVTDI